jgi:hypothetical protein
LEASQPQFAIRFIKILKLQIREYIAVVMCQNAVDDHKWRQKWNEGAKEFGISLRGGSSSCLTLRYRVRRSNSLPVERVMTSDTMRSIGSP